MAYLVGADEAGYGPNLGPLVITATVWQVDSLHDVDLYRRLRGVVRTADEEIDRRIAVADSKLLYKPGQGLGGLEQGVYPCLRLLGRGPRSWQAIWQDLQADPPDHRGRLPWYRDYDSPLPVAIPDAEATAGAESLRAEFDRTGCRLIDIESRAVFPPEFNDLVAALGNKASLLSAVTLQLVKSALGRLPADEPVQIVCDKHGGRNRYGPLLQDNFPDTLAVVRCEGRRESLYCLGAGTRRREFSFRARGESFLPSALASMVSKYLRELSMQAFNCFWRRHVAELRPTAGYPVDAKRFKRQILGVQRELGVSDHELWRCR